MAQESYADYSIIHKYMEQQKLHEEELRRFTDKIDELEHKLSTTTEELEKSKAGQQELQAANEDLRRQIAERDNEIRRLNTTINNLNKKISAITKGGRG